MFQTFCQCGKDGLHDPVVLPSGSTPVARRGLVISADCPHPRPFGRVLEEGEGYLIIRTQNPLNLLQMRMNLG